MEHLLHYVWKHKLFSLKMLQTTTGLPIEVIDPGLHNSNAGPDFFNAKLKIGDTLWVGNVEIHTLSSDWYRHKHDQDKTYNSVILHVASKVDCEIFRPNGEIIPQIQLTCPEQIQVHYKELCQANAYPPCRSILASLSKLTIHSWLTSLQTERLEQKAAIILKRLEHCNRNWEDAFFITLARNFGFGLNGDAFETWAGMLPFRAIEKHRDDLFQVEAFFYGVAGFLEEEKEEDYYACLRKEFRYMQHKFEFTSTMDVSLWRLLRLRPGNFPFIRLAQLAYLYQKSDVLFSRLMEAETLNGVRKLLATRTSAYWEEHFVFGKISSYSEKKIGDKSVDLLIINTVIPFLYAYGLHKADDKMCARAGYFLEELKAENNFITRKWKLAGISVETAADSQALIQLQKEYCEKRKCLYCRIGYEYLKV